MSLHDALQYKSQIDKLHAELTSTDDKLRDEMDPIIDTIVEAPAPTAKELVADPERLAHLKQVLSLVLGEIHSENAYHLAQWLFDIDEVFFNIQTHRNADPEITFTVRTTQATAVSGLTLRIQTLISLIHTVYISQMRHITVKVTDPDAEKETTILRLGLAPRFDTDSGDSPSGWWIRNHDWLARFDANHHDTANLAAGLAYNELYAD